MDIASDNINMNLTANPYSCELHWIMSEYHRVFQICDVSEDISVPIIRENQSQWPCSLRLGIKPLDCWERGFESRWRLGCSVIVFVACCVGCGITDGLISPQQESYQVYESVCDLEISIMRRSKLKLGCYFTEKKIKDFLVVCCSQHFDSS